MCLCVCIRLSFLFFLTPIWLRWCSLDDIFSWAILPSLCNSIQSRWRNDEHRYDVEVNPHWQRKYVHTDERTFCIYCLCHFEATYNKKSLSDVAWRLCAYFVFKYVLMTFSRAIFIFSGLSWWSSSISAILWIEWSGLFRLLRYFLHLSPFSLFAIAAWPLIGSGERTYALQSSNA